MGCDALSIAEHPLNLTKNSVLQQVFFLLSLKLSVRLDKTINKYSEEMMERKALVKFYRIKDYNHDRIWRQGFSSPQ